MDVLFLYDLQGKNRVKIINISIFIICIIFHKFRFIYWVDGSHPACLVGWFATDGLGKDVAPAAVGPV